MVYIKLQPYIQNSVATRSSQKLSYKYFGSFKVIQKVGMVAYKLDLPSDARIHPVLHVSQLKKYIPLANVVDTDLSVMVPGQDACPVHILESQLVNKGSSMINQLKVRWSHLPAHYTT